MMLSHLLLLYPIPIFLGLCRNASNNVYSGLYVDTVANGANAELIVKKEVKINSNNYGIYSSLPNSNSNLDIVIESDATLNLDQNGYGFRAYVFVGAKLNVDVKENGSFESCGNPNNDIDGQVVGNLIFSGDGYTCDQVQFAGGGAVDEPVCEPCA
jgi:hypothetical protein